MNAFDWLNDLMRWIGKWFPRFVLVKAGYHAIRFGRKGRTEELTPGLYCYWPIVADLTIVSVRRRTTEIASQLHGSEIVSVVVAYAVVKPLAMWHRFDDIFSQIDDRIQASLGAHYSATESNEHIAANMTDTLRSEFGPYGLEIYSVDVVQRGKVIPLKNLNDWAQHASPTL